MTDLTVPQSDGPLEETIQFMIICQSQVPFFAISYSAKHMLLIKYISIIILSLIVNTILHSKLHSEL